jgi:1-acyl-sn-glycerol-3-phosphate acyltransferase
MSHHTPEDAGQFSLLSSKRFGPFFGAQFLGAFNDNLVKQAMLALLTFQGAAYTDMSLGLVTNLAAGIFILPFFLFSALAGTLADKFERSGIIRMVKVLEIGIMLLALGGFYLKSFPILMSCIGLLGLHSTIFGPVKYAILPQHIERSRLVGANALVEAGTFLAILGGTIGGGLFGAMGQQGGLYAAATGLACAVAGLAFAWRIPKAAAPSPEIVVGANIFKQTAAAIGFARQPASVWNSILGISWFWFYGALLLSQFPSYAKDVLGGGPTGITLLLATFSIGVGLGNIACEKLSFGRIEIGLVPLGSIGMSIFGADLFFASPAAPLGAALGAWALLGFGSVQRIVFDLAMLGFFGGLYIVPLYALIQTRSNEATRSRVIAANNILNAAFMVGSALVGIVAFKLGASIPVIFLGASLANVLVAFHIYRLVPEFLLRFMAFILTRVLYRVDLSEFKDLPEEGPILLTCNHVSFVDAVILMGCFKRPIRFVMDHNIFKAPLLGFVFRGVKAIPIASAKESKATMDQAFASVSQALKDGEAVLIFPEGRITHDGSLSPFRPGMEMILASDSVPTQHVALRGLWGSFFSRAHGKAMSKPFARGALNRVSVLCSEPMPAGSVDAAKAEAITRAMLADPVPMTPRISTTS